jgi:hypothetical protein
MKQPITLRIDPILLAMAKQHAVMENRTLTNFIETLLKRQMESGRTWSGALAPPSRNKVDRRPSGRVSRKKGGTGNLE